MKSLQNGEWKLLRLSTKFLGTRWLFLAVSGAASHKAAAPPRGGCVAYILDLLEFFCSYKRSAAYACSLHQMLFCELPSKLGDVVECSGFFGAATVLAGSQIIQLLQDEYYFLVPPTFWIFRIFSAVILQ